ncbi:MAG: M28 family metallopeptidase [Bacteroidales bacterium]
MKNCIILLLLCFLFSNAMAQDSVYARNVMMKLGSKEFHGRGYVNGGIDSAASYIEKEFTRLGLKPVEESYVQTFDISVNNFTSLELIIDGKKLRPGTDFILNAHSSAVFGDFKTIYIDESIRTSKKKLNTIIPKISGKILFLKRYETKDKDALQWYDAVAHQNPFKAAGIIVLDSGNLTYSVAMYDKLISHFTAQLAPGAFPQKPAKSVSCNIKNNFISKYPVKNVAAYLQGQQYADSFIVITAHYDHIGMLGDAMFPGGNDNASGVAMMLDLARHLKDQNFRPRYSIIFIALASEEAGLFGSTWFAEHPMMDLKRIRFLLNLDMVGSGSTGITVVNGSKFKNEFQKLVDINNENKFINGVKERGEACNSDHCPFYQRGVPSFFIYTTGKEYEEYHNINDKPEAVPMTAYNGLFRLVESFMYAL